MPETAPEAEDELLEAGISFENPEKPLFFL